MTMKRELPIKLTEQCSGSRSASGYSVSSHLIDVGANEFPAKRCRMTGQERHHVMTRLAGLLLRSIATREMRSDGRSKDPLKVVRDGIIARDFQGTVLGRILPTCNTPSDILGIFHDEHHCDKEEQC